MNDELELDLRKALQRVPAPEGFTARVLDRLPANAPPLTWWRWAVAASLVCVLLLSGLYYRQQRREQDARRTEQQVIFAFTLAAEKLQHVNYRLQRTTPDLNLQKKRGNHYDE